MGLTVSAKGNDFESTPEGVFPARCIRIIDMGTQRTTWEGKEKLQHKVAITWELLGDERMKDGRPFAISKRYTASFNDKAQLRKDLQAWRGKPFTEAELASFNIGSIIGTYCLIQVVHAEKNGETYANVGSIMALPKGSARPDPVNPTIVFDFDRPETHVNLEALGQRMQEQIKATPEWAAVERGKSASDADVPIFNMDEEPAF